MVLAAAADDASFGVVDAAVPDRVGIVREAEVLVVARPRTETAVAVRLGIVLVAAATVVIAGKVDAVAASHGPAPP